MSLNCSIKRISWDWLINFEAVVWESNQNSKSVNSEVLLMRNGTGKTTTLQLLQRLFTNTPLKMSDGGENEEILKRCKYKGLASTKEIGREKVGSPEFSVTVDVEGSEHTLIFEFEKDYSEANIRTQGPSEHYDDYKMPPSFTSAFEHNLEFAKLIFVDTQVVGQAGKHLNKIVLDDLLKTMSNVKVLESTRKVRIPEIIADEAKKAQRKGGAKQRDEAQAGIRRCKSTIEKIETALAIAERDIEIKRAAHKATEDKIEAMRKQSGLQIDYQKQLSKMKQAKIRAKNTSKELLTALIDPANLPEDLWSPVKDYYSRLASSRIPKSIAKEYLSAVLNEGKCICGRDIHGPEEKCINEKMQESMGLGILSEVYIMKDQISTSSPQVDIVALKNRLDAEETALEGFTTKVENLDARLDSDSRDTLDSLGREEGELASIISKLTDEIEMYSCTDDGTIKTNKKAWLRRSIKANGDPAEGRGALAECKNLYWLDVIRKNLNKKLAAIAGIEDLSIAGDAIMEMFEAVELSVLQHLQSELKMETDRHLSKYNMQNDLRIHSLSDGMQLSDGEGNIQDGFSTGEELSIIFSLVEAISSTVDLTVPMIVDNPTKGLGADKAVAVEDSLEGFTHQLVLMIYDTERGILPNYLDSENVNPAVFLREHEVHGNKIGKGKKGNYIVKYDWGTFSSYTPKGSDHLQEVA